MRILALETSSVFCSAALLCDGEVHGVNEKAPRKHGERLLPMMEQVLARAQVGLKQLDAIAFGCGPGSFTGVRIAAAVAQGVAFGAGVPLVGISTLAALAHAGWRQHGQTPVLAVMDARIGELYWGLFDVAGQGKARALQSERVGPADQVDLTAGLGDYGGVLSLGVGNGWSLYRDVLTARTGLGDARIDASVAASAADIAELAVSAVAAGERLAPEQGLPVYLRDQVATKPKGMVAVS